MLGTGKSLRFRQPGEATRAAVVTVQITGHGCGVRGLD